MGRYVKREDVVIEAVELKHQMVLRDITGNEKVGQPGDFLVNGVLGQQYIVQRAVFLTTYQKAPRRKKDATK
jgi:hypothetical protein